MGRRGITERTAWDDAFAQVAYTADALALAGADGDKEVGALAAPVEAVLKSWDGVDGERRGGRRGVGRAHALVRRRDHDADAADASIHADVLHDVKGDRAHPLFAFLFAKPLFEVVRLALGSELPTLRELLGKLAAKEVPAAIRKAHEKALDRVIKRGEDALKAREDAFVTQALSAARMAAWRDDANHVLMGVEGELLAVSARRRPGPGWVDTFFPEGGGRARPKADEPAPPPPVSPAAPPR